MNNLAQEIIQDADAHRTAEVSEDDSGVDAMSRKRDEEDYRLGLNSRIDAYFNGCVTVALVLVGVYLIVYIIEKIMEAAR